MARGVRIKLNSDTVQRYLDGEFGVSTELHARADKILAQAKSTAEVVTGAYRDGLHIEEAHTDRLVVQVAGGSNHDWIVEAKTGNLAKALDAAGGA